MRIELSNYVKVNDEWLKRVKVFYEIDEFVKYIESDEYRKYSLEINRTAK